MSYYEALFTESMNDKKGLTIYIAGQTVVGIVTKVNGGDTVEMRSREASRIIVRIDRIDAVTIS